MKKIFQGDKDELVKDIKEWLDENLREYDRADVILELLEKND